PGVPFPALAHRRAGARARRDDARGVPRGARGRRRERHLSAHGRGAGSRRPPRRRLRRVAPGGARAADARGAVPARRPVPDDAGAGPRAALEPRRSGAGGGASVSRIDDYRQVAPQGAVDMILKLADRVRGRRFLNVTGGRLGGGAAEILREAVPILSDLGVDTSWEITEGDSPYYATARALQATLEGAERVLSDEGLARWVEVNRVNAKKLTLDADLVLVHDVQPASLVTHRTDGRWVWRCHFDCSAARPAAWSFFRRFADQYDAAVFSLPGFECRLGIPTYVIQPSIDPLSEKNRDLSPREVADSLDELLQAACEDPDVVVLELPADAHRQINALQRAATIVLQKSVRAGFELGPAEAMWKGKPVIGGYAGGLAQQIIPDVTGYMVHSV